MQTGIRGNYYGLERLASYIQDKENVFDLEWTDGFTLRDIFGQPEYEHSKYTFETSDTEMLFYFLTCMKKKHRDKWKKGLFIRPMIMF